MVVVVGKTAFLKRLLLVVKKQQTPTQKQQTLQPKPTPKKETPKSNPEPKFDPTKHERFLWEFETGGYVTSSPAIGSDGTVYVGSEDDKLYAINGQTGVKLWEFQTGMDVYSSPAIGSDGTVYVGSEDKKLYAIKAESLGPAKSP